MSFVVIHHLTLSHPKPLSYDITPEPLHRNHKQFSLGGKEEEESLFPLFLPLSLIMVFIPISGLGSLARVREIVDCFLEIVGIYEWTRRMISLASPLSSELENGIEEKRWEQGVSCCTLLL